jgi:hypothetical protein
MCFLWAFFLALMPLGANQIDNGLTHQLEEALLTAQTEFERAKSRFSPWYTGPLLTPGASMMPVGQGNTQPFLFIIDNYAIFNKKRKSVKISSHLVQLKATANIQTGVTENFDLNISFLGQGNWQFNQCGGGFGDINLTAGLCILKQTHYVPDIKLTITETFPTGKYKNFDPRHLFADSVGAGTFSTQFGLAFSKLILWTTKHPMTFRCFFGYQLSTPVNVSGFNSYGGGFGCKGRIRPGNSFNADFGAEISITQKWVAALDMNYTMRNRTRFRGNSGIMKNGEFSLAGIPYSDNLSLAPALEYNWNPKLGAIAGAWFSVYGRTSLNFVSGIISITYSFP